MRWVYSSEREDDTPNIGLWRYDHNALNQRVKVPRKLIRFELRDTSRYPADKPLNKARECARRRRQAASYMRSFF